tara:strand:- start:793 stop:1452 length:660 start_codon:yes stop_codon:yes gene_type:complete
MKEVVKLENELKQSGVEVVFNNMSAVDVEKRLAVINELKSKNNIKIKIFMHSLAFGALLPVIGSQSSKTLQQRQIEMTLDVMASSLIFWTQDLYNASLLKVGSHIFAMTSSGGHRQWPSYGAVSAAKAALESYCRQLALELSSEEISVNAIQAGVTDTPALRKIPGNEKMIIHASNINPGKRLTKPDDIAKYIALIGLNNNTWLTGNTIRIDGGEDITG